MNTNTASKFYDEGETAGLDFATTTAEQDQLARLSESYANFEINIPEHIDLEPDQIRKCIDPDGELDPDEFWEWAVGGVHVESDDIFEEQFLRGFLRGALDA